MNLTKYDIAILLGLLLGNGYIDSKGQIHIKHSKKQKEYCEFKAKLVHSICGGSNIKIKESINGTNKFKKQSKRFQQIRKLLYSENKKTINNEILNLIQPISIALWWMDKGNVIKSADSFTLKFFINRSLEESKLIQNYFLSTYNIKWDIIPSDIIQNKYILSCNDKKFLAIIKDIVSKVKCMQYKIIDI